MGKQLNISVNNTIYCIHLDISVIWVRGEYLKTVWFKLSILQQWKENQDNSLSTGLKKRNVFLELMSP